MCPCEVPGIGGASGLTPHLVPGSATSTSSLSRLRASWVLPLHNREVERSLRGSPREEPWSDLLGQLRVGWGGPWVHPSPTFHGLKDNDKISFEKKESL